MTDVTPYPKLFLAPACDFKTPIKHVFRRKDRRTLSKELKTDRQMDISNYRIASDRNTESYITIHK